MEGIIVRLLKANEIECRIGTVKENGLSLLLYKDARVDQRILDETFGAFGWKRSHQCIDGNLYCTVEVYDKDKGAWVAKQDVGTTGTAEKEKSQASDSFKRACFNWGIGRELYTAPFVWISSGAASIRKQDGRLSCADRFHVASIGYGADREITELAIENDRGITVYELKEKGRGKEGAPKGNALTKPQIDRLNEELKRTGVDMEAVKGRYKIKQPEQMSEELYKKVMNALAKTKSARVA